VLRVYWKHHAFCGQEYWSLSTDDDSDKFTVPNSRPRFITYFWTKDSFYDRFIAAPRLYKIIRANEGPDVPHFDGEPEHSLDIVELVDTIEHIGLEDIGKTPK